MIRNRTKYVCKNIFSATLALLTCVVTFFVIIFVTFNLFYFKTNVRGYSMRPTLNNYVKSMNEDGDTVYINEHREFYRDEIVIAKAKWFDNLLIKRLVAMPGDELQIVQVENTYELRVNGEVLYTKNVNSNTTTHVHNYNNILMANAIDGEDYSENIIDKGDGNIVFKLLDNQYFLMGDNWGYTDDSIKHGPVTRNEIVGVVDLVIGTEQNSAWEMFKFSLKVLFN